MNRRIKLCLAFALVLIMSVCLLSISAAAEEGQTNSAVQVLNPMEWAEQYPDQYNSWVAGMHEEYGQSDESGKINAWYTVVQSDVPNMVGCYRCHSGTFLPLLAKYGDDLLTTDLSQIQLEITTMANNTGVGCYSCHGNEPGEPTIMNYWITEAAEKGGIETKQENLRCAQCHSLPDWSTIGAAGALGFDEYKDSNPDPSTWSLLQYGIDVESVWNHFDEIGFMQPRMTTEMPFNNYYGSTMERLGVTCADCHTTKAVNAAGEEYTVHIFQGVSNNEAIYDNCAACHQDGVDGRKEAVAALAASYDENLAKAEAVLADLSAAIEASSVSDDVKAEASHLLAKATFYTDYGTDSSKGVHSYSGGMSEKCFEQALAIVEEAKALLG